jgi:hypothetical protein
MGTGCGLVTPHRTNDLELSPIESVACRSRAGFGKSARPPMAFGSRHSRPAVGGHVGTRTHSDAHEPCPETTGEQELSIRVEVLLRRETARARDMVCLDIDGFLFPLTTGAARASIKTLPARRIQTASSRSAIRASGHGRTENDSCCRVAVHRWSGPSHPARPRSSRPASAIAEHTVVTERQGAFKRSSVGTFVHTFAGRVGQRPETQLNAGRESLTAT